MMVDHRSPAEEMAAETRYVQELHRLLAAELDVVHGRSAAALSHRPGGELSARWERDVAVHRWSGLPGGAGRAVAAAHPGTGARRAAELAGSAGADPVLHRVDGVAWTVSDAPLLDELVEVLGPLPRRQVRLEFDVVVVVDPEAIGARCPADLYVAMTRATRRLVLVH